MSSIIQKGKDLGIIIKSFVNFYFVPKEIMTKAKIVFSLWLCFLMVFLCFSGFLCRPLMQSDEAEDSSLGFQRAISRLSPGGPDPRHH